ncbi:MAG: (2Fe-2S) ferredoxin domain-containing protein [Eubacteriales bacterium]
MVVIRICVGSSCHLRGSRDIIERLEQEIASAHLEDRIELTGAFCFGKCNRIGVTVAVDDEICTGITKENFKEFWNEKVLRQIESGQ